MLLYASYLKTDFNVVAIAVSGETERELKTSHFLWLKQKHSPKDISDNHLLDPKSLFRIIDEQAKPISEEELTKKAIEYNNLFQGYGIPETERCTVISCILVALQDEAFEKSYKSHHSDDDSDYNPNEALLDALLRACQTVLERNKLDKKKRDVILGEYTKIKQHAKFTEKKITLSQSRELVTNTILRDIIQDLHENIMPYVHQNIFDLLGQFYTIFIRYAGSDSKIGLVLTPQHITDLFCYFSEINENDVVLDPCCGTGGFLVSAMKRMLYLSKNNDKKHQDIKSKQLIGIEQKADMFSHACSNMMMRGDGKSNIHRNDCFDPELKQQIRDQEKPTKALLNPPYAVGEDGQLCFVENSLEYLQPNGIAVAICQMSAAVSSKNATIEVKKRLMEHHTLEAVLSMPDDLFYPVGVVTCILVFKAHVPHPANKETFFGYFKDDGFIKVKNKGRIDINSRWGEIKSQWLNAYTNRKNVAGLSVTHAVLPEDEWCAEAYLETDYSKLTGDDFVQTIRDFVAFQFQQGYTHETM